MQMKNSKQNATFDRFRRLSAALNPYFSFFNQEYQRAAKELDIPS